ncbi:hypothetical protein CIB84_011976 [Bambusicola thoracicus]|uniref:SUN domain-containing protein n=1 Tax=Bambusicola thoracicus TaxID=9083 RepID=A0A2P4SJJ0_BAMTH|nr:hypothetical protein CIB84_011976 [Bambusicola thoracicus]
MHASSCCQQWLVLQWKAFPFQMLSLLTAPRQTNSGNLLTEQTLGTENQRNGVPKEKRVTKCDRALKRAALSAACGFGCTGSSVGLMTLLLPALCFQPDLSPGYCWPMKAAQSQVVFNLPAEVQPTAVTVQHSVETNLWHISSAPRDFTVYGLDEEGEMEALLGTFIYDVRKEATQTFQLRVQSLRMGRRPFQKHCFGSKPGVKSLAVLFVLQTETPRAFWYIKLVVLNNWGNAGHTCIYRVQVHARRTNS